MLEKLIPIITSYISSVASDDALQVMSQKLLHVRQSSLKEVKESNALLIDSNNRISEDVSNLNKKVTKLESDLKVSEEKRERLEAQSRRENLRIYGLPEEKNETWEDTESKVRE